MLTSNENGSTTSTLRVAQADNSVQFLEVLILGFPYDVSCEPYLESDSMSALFCKCKKVYRSYTPVVQLFAH